MLKSPNRHGYITTDGIVVCGECVTDHNYAAAVGTARDRDVYRTAAYEACDPTAGDDWCSVCDADIAPRYPQGETVRLFEPAPAPMPGQTTI